MGFGIPEDIQIDLITAVNTNHFVGKLGTGHVGNGDFFPKIQLSAEVELTVLAAAAKNQGAVVGAAPEGARILGEANAVPAAPYGQ